MNGLSLHNPAKRLSRLFSAAASVVLGTRGASLAIAEAATTRRRNSKENSQVILQDLHLADSRPGIQGIDTGYLFVEKIRGVGVTSVTRGQN